MLVHLVLIDSVFEGELAEAIPVVHASIAGCRIVGRLCVGKITRYLYYRTCIDGIITLYIII